MVLMCLAGLMNREQHMVIDYLREENKILKEHLSGKRLRYTDKQRRRLALKAKSLGCKILGQIVTLVTPDALLAWHRKLIAKKLGADGISTVGGRRFTLSVGEILLRKWVLAVYLS